MIHHLMWRSTVALTGWDISGYHTKKHDALKIALLAYFRKEREREREARGLRGRLDNSLLLWQHLICIFGRIYSTFSTVNIRLHSTSEVGKLDNLTGHNLYRLTIQPVNNVT